MRILTMVLGLMISGVCSSDPCTSNLGSCIKLINQSRQAIKLECRTMNSEAFALEAQADSENTSQLNPNLNDGMGYPSPGELFCQINSDITFHFQNLYWGPTIEVRVLPKLNIDILGFDFWSNEKFHYSLGQ